MKEKRKIFTLLALASFPLLSLFSCSGPDTSSSSHAHDFQTVSETAATCTENGNKTERCSICGEERTETEPALGHSFGEWHQKSPATCLENEKLERTCARDGYSETKDGASALGHLWGEWVTEGDNMVRRCLRDDCEEKEEKLAPLVRVYGPEEGATPFLTTAKNYLEAIDPNVHDYSCQNDGLLGYKVRWINTFNDVTSFRIDCSKDASFSTCESSLAPASANEQYVYNLEKAATYYIKVTAITPSGEHPSNNIVTFQTSDLGPRVMKIDGIHNVRDIGGYLTPEGRTLQGKIFRGGALSPCTFAAYANINLSESGKKYMSETLKIKTDFDLRARSENRAPGTPEDSGLTVSPIPNANLEYHTVNGYESIFSEKEAYREAFSALSDESRYPIYLHCTGGADRTGTVSFLYNALLGVSESDLIHDYEYTSFSIYEERNSKDGSTYHFKQMYEKIQSDYEGDTLAEKVENFLLSIGVTETQIYNIRAIMHGQETREEDKPTPIAYNVPFDLTSGNITLSQTNKLAQGKVVGYDGTVYSVHLKEQLTSGGTFLFIGSYGFYLRGGNIRYAERTSAGFAEKHIDGAREVGGASVTISNSTLQSGTIIGLSATIKDSDKMTLAIYQNNTLVISYDYDRGSDEIASTEAKFEIGLGGDVSECIISSPTA